MQALKLHEGKIQFLTDAPPPIVQPHETLVKVIQAGICETDLQLIQGYMGFSGILGHEFVGIAQSGRFAGQRVVGEINCCSCQACQNNPAHRQHCPQRSVLGILNHDGAFAEYVAVPDANLHQVPDSLETQRAVLVEPLAAAFQILKQLAITSTERVIVLGDGRLGYLIAQVLAETGAELIVVGKHREKLERFVQRGLSVCLVDEVPPEWQEKRTADVVVDCTGHASGLPLAIRLVKPQGTIVLKTTVAGQQQLALAALVIDEIRLIGSRCGPFDIALQALTDQRIEVSSLITARFPLSQIERALEVAQQKNQHKVLIDFPD